MSANVEAMRADLAATTKAIEQAAADEAAGKPMDPAMKAEIIQHYKTLEYQIGRVQDTQQQRTNQEGFASGMRDALPGGQFLGPEPVTDVPRAVAGEGLSRIYAGAKQKLLAGRELLTPFGQQGDTGAYTAQEDLRRMAYNRGDEGREDAADLVETAALLQSPTTALRVAGALRELPATKGTLDAAIRAGKAGAIVGLTAPAFQELSPDAETVAGNAMLAAGLAGGISTVVGGIAGWLPTRGAGVAKKDSSGAVAYNDAGAAKKEWGFGPRMSNLFYNMKKDAAQNFASVQNAVKSWKVGSRSLAQQTGSVTQRSVESQFAATDAMNFFNTQFERFAGKSQALVRGMSREASLANAVKDPVTGKMVPRDPSFEINNLDVALAAGKAYRTQRETTIAAANASYGKRLSSAVAQAATDTAKFPIPFENAAAAVNKWQGLTSGEPWWRMLNPGAQKMGPEFKAVDDYLTGLAERNKILNNPPAPFETPRIGTVAEGLSLDQVVMFRRALSMADQSYYAAKAAGDTISAAMNNAHLAVRQTIKGFDADLAAFLAKNPSDRPAVRGITEFLKANKTHSEFFGVLHDTEQTMLANTLGYNAGKDPEAALVALARAEPRQQREIALVLKAQNPGALADLRVALVQNATREVMNAGTLPARYGSKDPNAWGQYVMDKHGGVFGKEIFAPAQYNQLTRGMSTIRMLKDGALHSENVNRVVSVESAGMASGTGSKAFLIRAAVRMFGLGKGEKILFSTEGLRSLEVLRNTTEENPEVIRRALTKIIAIMEAPEMPDPDNDGNG